MEKKYQLRENEINQNIKNVLGSDFLNVEKARRYLSNKNIEDILQEDDEQKEIKSRKSQKVKEEVQQKVESLEINLNDFIIALCNREGLTTDDFQGS